MRALAIALASLLLASSANAAPICETPAAFNAKGIVATSGTLTFKVKGIDPNVGKGALASFVDTRTKNTMGGPCVGTYFKVYGPGVDLGKVKDELYNMCCSAACGTCASDRAGTTACETWAGEARSSVIFTAPTQTCDIEVKFGGTPNQHSYSVKCDDGKGDVGVGDNTYLLQVNNVSVLSGYDGVGKIDGATILSEQFCYEPLTVAPPMDSGVVDSGPTTSTATIPVMEDVTASTATTGVYADVNDLSVGDDSEFFLKFVVPSTVGKVKKATLTMTVATTASADGDGGAIFKVDSNAWSETTMTWSTRPARGTRLGHVGPLKMNDKATLDVTSAITGPGTFSFAVGREPTDLNGTHFVSKEAPSGSANAPTLMLEYGPPDPTTPDAGTPPVTTPDAGTPATDSGSGARPDDSRSPESSEDFTGGCSFGSSANPSWLLLLAVLWNLRRRRVS
jgi:hypothetical protein